MVDWAAVDRATAALDPPLAALDLDAFDANAQDLRRRAGALPIRVASKSVRCRGLLERVLALPGFAGVLSYSLPEALWLARAGLRDILVAYPSAHRDAWRDLAADPVLAGAVCVMVDSTEQLDFIASVTGPAPAAEMRLCLEVDASLRIGPAHLGVRRSPVRTPGRARRLAEEIQRRQGMRLSGVMFYDAQIAGLPDTSAAVRWVKRRSAAELLQRRSAVIDAVTDVGPLDLVNGGGTGSLHVAGADPCLTELAAGSGLYGPTLFDGYRDFRPAPAMGFALPVVRRPARRIATVFSGGYLASGPPGWSRAPRPVWPPGLSLLRTEGPGEVQTPVRGRAARGLSCGDRVWFRHAKAGEMLERFDQVYCIREGAVADTVPTYRGEGRNFG